MARGNPWAAPGKTLFGWAMNAEQIPNCIQRQIQAGRALCSAPVLPCSGCRGQGKGRLKSLSSPTPLTPAAQLPPQRPAASTAPAQEAKPAECGAGCAHHRPVRLSWAKLLKRVFEIDMEHCPNCGGELKIIAAILWGEPGRRRS